jgi:hypothetical protein
VTSGELLGIEAISQLMTLHEDCLQRVRKKVPAFDSMVAESGADVVVTPLLGQLSDFYGVPVDEIVAGFAVRDDPDRIYDRTAQPRLDSGEIDTSVLVAECDAEFDRNGWGDRLCTVDAYATPYDPRLPLVRSRIGLRSEGIAWVSYLRPQNFQVARFDGLRLIHQQSNQWCLEFEDWRRRRFADRQDPESWLEFLAELRQISIEAGFEWKVPSNGRRAAAFDAVIYEMADWSDDQRRALTRSLLEASIPHNWEGSDLRIPRDFELKVDFLINDL